MALVLADRVRETTTTTGTGTVTLLGAFTGYQSFAAVGNGNTTYYTIAHQTLSEWEVGIGTYTSAGTTLSRTTVLSSSNAGSLVTFSAGTKDVFVTQPSSRAVYADGTTLTATNSSVLPVASGGTGLSSTPANGALNIGNGTGFTRTTLTAGTGISITNGAGSISIAATGGGTVTSVAVSGGTTGLTTSGGPITTSGTITLAGTLAVANGGTGVTTSTGSGNNVLSTSPTLTTPVINSATISTVSGSAPLYLCRAWVMFNGSSGSMYSQGNVSSITRNGTGNYVVNYSTAMPDANYSAVASCAGQGSTNGSTNCMLVNASAGGTNVTPTTTATTLFCYHSGNQVSQDTAFISFAVFR